MPVITRIRPPADPTIDAALLAGVTWMRDALVSHNAAGSSVAMIGGEIARVHARAGMADVDHAPGEPASPTKTRADAGRLPAYWSKFAADNYRP
jgi:hypothetical protein